MATGDPDDELTTTRPSTLLALVRAELRDVKDNLAALSKDVNELYREGVLRRIVELERRLGDLERRMLLRNDEGETFRRRAWTDAALVILGAGLAYAAARLQK